MDPQIRLLAHFLDMAILPQIQVDLLDWHFYLLSADYENHAGFKMGGREDYLVTIYHQLGFYLQSNVIFV